MVISNCEITRQDSEILRTCILDTNNSEYKKTKQFHTGVDLSGSKIYSAYSGTVVWIGEDESGKCVIVQTGSSFCVCYRHLSFVNVRLGQDINKSMLLGSANKYVHVELLQKTSNIWPVRIGSQTWYKHDPQPILDDTLVSANIAQFENMGILELSSNESGTI